MEEWDTTTATIRGRTKTLREWSVFVPWTGKPAGFKKKLQELAETLDLKITFKD